MAELIIIPTDLVKQLHHVKVSKFGYVSREQEYLLLQMIIWQRYQFNLQEFVAHLKPREGTSADIEMLINQMRLNNLVTIDRQMVTVSNQLVKNLMKDAKEYQELMLEQLSIAKNKQPVTAIEGTSKPAKTPKETK
jgi:hypothetical protein